MAKYSKRISDKIIALVEEDNYTISGICRIVGINRDTFYEWRATKPCFAEALHEAEERRTENLRLQARKAMRKKLEEQERIEIKTVYVPCKDKENPEQLTIKEYIVKQKYCLPRTQDIVFALSEFDRGENRSSPSFHNPPLIIQVPDDETRKALETLKENSRKQAKIRHIENR